MDREELIKRTKAFAHRCVKVATALPENALGKHIRGQLIKCSTSVAANYGASCLSQSKPSFIAKISIVLEETDETDFWLEFIIDEKLLNKNQVEPLQQEAEELTAIFAASRKTANTKKKIEFHKYSIFNFQYSIIGIYRVCNRSTQHPGLRLQLVRVCRGRSGRSLPRTIPEQCAFDPANVHRQGESWLFAQGFSERSRRHPGIRLTHR